MRHSPRRATILFLGLMAVVAFPATVGAAKPRAKKVADPTANNEKMIRAGQVTGKILTVLESKKSIRVQVTMVLPQITAGALNNYLSAEQAMQRANSPQALYNAQVQLAKAEANLVSYTRVTKDYELQTTDDVKIRLAKPPEQFDDKGGVKKLTRKQLRELKGDPKLPGYPGEFSNLREGQIVSVTLVRKKGAPTKYTRPVRPRGKKTKLEDVDLMTDNLPQASMIHVVVEPK